MFNSLHKIHPQKLDDDDDIDEDDDSWSNRADYSSIENNVGMIEFIYFIFL